MVTGAIRVCSVEVFDDAPTKAVVAANGGVRGVGELDDDVTVGFEGLMAESDSDVQTTRSAITLSLTR